MKVDKVLIALPFVASALGLAALGALAMAEGTAQASGVPIAVPVHVPVNQCGNTANVIGALNPAFANHC